MIKETQSTTLYQQWTQYRKKEDILAIKNQFASKPTTWVTEDGFKVSSSSARMA